MPRKPLTYLHEDSDKRVPNPILIGMQLRHQGNKKLYIITGFCWMGATDQWGFLHAEWTETGVAGVPLVRPLEHLFGYRENGEVRYQIEAQVRSQA